MKALTSPSHLLANMFPSLSIPAQAGAVVTVGSPGAHDLE